MKTALRGGEKLRLSVLRMLLAAIKQREIDERRELEETEVMQVIEKQAKQRRESASLFADAGRAELEQQENDEAEILKAYLPEPQSESECAALLDDVISATGAASMKDMGKVMGLLKGPLAGRADMGAVSAQVRALLAG